MTDQASQSKPPVIDPDNPPVCPKMTRLYSWNLEKMKVGDKVGIQSRSQKKCTIVKINRITPSGQIITEDGSRFTKNGEEIGVTSIYKKTLCSVEYAEYMNAVAQIAEMRSRRAEEICAICDRIGRHVVTWRITYKQLDELRNRLVEIDELIQQQANEREAELEKERQARKQQLQQTQ